MVFVPKSGSRGCKCPRGLLVNRLITLKSLQQISLENADFLQVVIMDCHGFDIPGLAAQAGAPPSVSGKSVCGVLDLVLL